MERKPASPKAAARDKRLAMALKANLARRKAQARKVKPAEKPGKTPAD